MSNIIFSASLIWNMRRTLLCVKSTWVNLLNHGSCCLLRMRGRITNLDGASGGGRIGLEPALTAATSPSRGIQPHGDLQPAEGRFAECHGPVVQLDKVAHDGKAETGTCSAVGQLLSDGKGLFV